MDNSQQKFFNALATLGDPPINNLTSSYYVAEKRFLSHRILGLSSFEDAVNSVKNGEAEVALVAGAYPKIRDFIMDPSLICVEAFVEQIPPLVVAGIQNQEVIEVKTIYLHPATIPLLKHVNVKYNQLIETQATSAAASKAKDDKKSVAICNQLAADYYQLNIFQILIPSLNMPFALFKVNKKE